MSLSPSSSTPYNGQSVSFSCPYVEGAVQWEWWSDNASAASVSPSGQNATVTAHNSTGSDIGGITIYCNAKNEFNQTITQHNASFTAKTCPATGMSVSPGTISLTYDNQYGYMTGTPTTNQGGGAQVSLPAVTYASENTGVCTVTGTGLLNADSNGTARVWVGAVNYPGISGFCDVTVTGFPTPVTGVTLNKTATSLNVGSGEQLTKTIIPANATNQNVTWSSNNTSVATIDANGYVTAVGIGVVNVKVTTQDGGYQALCTVTVSSANVPVTGVSISQPTMSLAIGAQGTLTTTVSPSNATNKGVSWSTNNSGVAQVSSGVVTAIGAGSCYITVTTNDGGFTASCLVTVGTIRPSNFAYTYAKTSGGAVYSTSVIGGVITAYIMPATEWNALTARINDFRLYKGLAMYGFTSVSSGSDFTPAIYNQAVNAINAMGFSLPTASSGNISAAMLNSLVTTINSIV